MNEQRLLDTFLDLVRLPCPSGREARAAAYCKDALEGCGCTVTIDDAGEKIGSDTGNLYAELAGTVDGTIILTAHLDCVQPCEGVNPQIVDGVIYSDGTTVLGGDDKVGVAAIIEAVRALVEEPHRQGHLQRSGGDRLPRCGKLRCGALRDWRALLRLR